MSTDRELAGTQHRSIERANQQKNPFSEIAEKYGKYERDDLKIDIIYKNSKEMSKEMLKFCFKLAERNVGSYYKACALGWQPKVKQNDMQKSWAKFLIAKAGEKIAGFCQFRFDMDYGRSVVYWYAEFYI